jgi:hypothetical protein
MLETLYKSGVIEVLVGVMQVLKLNPIVMKVACKVLVNIGVDKHYKGDLFRKADAVGALLLIIKELSSNEEVMKPARDLLFAFAVVGIL